MLNQEIWKDIKETNGKYEVSDLGRIRNKKNKKCLSQCLNKGGYCFVYIYALKKTKSVHRIVAIEFISNPENKKTVNHIDGNKCNNRAGNLEWLTQKENNDHAFARGLKSGNNGETNGRSKLSNKSVNQIRKMRKNGVAIKDLAEKFNVCKNTIGNVVYNRNWRHL